MRYLGAAAALLMLTCAACGSYNRLLDGRAALLRGDFAACENEFSAAISEYERKVADPRVALSGDQMPKDNLATALAGRARCRKGLKRDAEALADAERSLLLFSEVCRDKDWRLERDPCRNAADSSELVARWKKESGAQ